MRRVPLAVLALVASSIVGAIGLAQQPAPAGPVDLVLRHGVIATADPARPRAEAIAIAGDRIVAVGDDQAIGARVGPSTRVIDLLGRLVVPGFIDSHAHFYGVGQMRQTIDLMAVKNWDEVVARVETAAKSAEPGAWIVGRGWHQEKWDHPPSPAVEGFPVHDSLSRVSPANPVALKHASGHASFVNAKALELAGITAATPNPPGGEILHDSTGRPTGLLRESAAGLADRVLEASRARRTPAEIEAEARRTLDLAIEESLSKGVTSFQDAGASFDLIDLYKRYVNEDRLGVRLWVMIGEPNDTLARRIDQFPLVDYAGKHRLTVRAIKRYMDGALGSRGAWLLAPYSDQPASSGLNAAPIADLDETARLAAARGLQLCVHAIGDRANRETLDVFARAFAGHADATGRRWRIEHAQHLDPADIPRFKQLGVIAAMQGIHCTSDAPFVLARLGPARAEAGAYVWQKLLKSGAVVSNGTDAPVEDMDPIANFYATVARRLKDGTVFYGDQRMSREEALRAYTLSGAYAAFEEDLKGSITPGKLADVVVLSRDIMGIPEDQIPGTVVVQTIVGGKVVYSRP